VDEPIRSICGTGESEQSSELPIQRNFSLFGKDSVPRAKPSALRV